MTLSASPGAVLESSQGCAPARTQAEPLKKCILCEENKPHSAFNKDNRNKVDGLFNVCKACKKEQKLARAEGLEPAKARRSGRGKGRSRNTETPLVTLAKALAAHAKEELDAQRLTAKIERESQENQRRCKAYVDWLITNDGRPVKCGKVHVPAMVFAVARAGGTMYGWPVITDEDREMAERYGRLPCLWSMSLSDALEQPEWLHLYSGWNPTNYLNYSAWAAVKSGADAATLYALITDGGVMKDASDTLSDLSVDVEWNVMVGEN